MFRRIELIWPQQRITLPDGKHETYPAFKQGLVGVAPTKVIDAWFGWLGGPNCDIPRNAKFYFTEVGWREVGRKVIEACQQVGQDYRVVRIKHCEVDVVWRDRRYHVEVAAQPRKKRYRARPKMLRKDTDCEPRI